MALAVLFTVWTTMSGVGCTFHCVDDNASPSLVGKLDNILGMSVTVWTTMSGVGCTFHSVDDNEWRWLYFSLCGRQ